MPGYIDRLPGVGLVKKMVRRARPIVGVSVDVRQATLSESERSLIRELVVESRNLDGPIIEIGTLIGATTTQIALEKAPHQKVITVDKYCWNPWMLTPDAHHALAAQVLHYLTTTGHVEQKWMGKDEFYASYSGPAPSMVFLDAIHTYEETKIDIEWAIAVGAKIISGHDYGPEFPGVIQAVGEFGGPSRLRGTVFVLPPRK